KRFVSNEFSFLSLITVKEPLQKSSSMRDWKKLALAVGILVGFSVTLALWKGAWLDAGAISIAGLAVVIFVYATMVPYDELVVALDRLAAGDLSQPALTVEASGSVGT